MGALISFIGIVGGIYVCLLLILKFRALFKFVKHPLEADVEIAEGLQGAIYNEGSWSTSGWKNKTSLVRMRIATKSKFEVTILRKRELMGNTNKAYFGKTGHEDFDKELILLKPSDDIELLFFTNLETRNLILNYFRDFPEITQLKFQSGYIESMFIHSGDRILESSEQFNKVTPKHIIVIKAIRKIVENI